MSGDNYFIRYQQNCYFLTLTVVKWIDLFTRREFKDVITDSLNYCVKHKGLELYAWVIMSNHIHFAGRVNTPHRMSDFLRDFKKFTSKRFIRLMELINESRKEWLLEAFSIEAQRIGRAKNYKIWRDDNHAIDLETYNIDLIEKIDYIHKNPVKAGLVENPEDYVYSSARDYCGKKGLVEIVLV